MAEQIKIPKILQEREGPSIGEKAKEKSKELRKRASHKVGKFITYSMYYAQVERKDKQRGKDEQQDEAYDTYSQNLKEAYHRIQVDKVRELGSLAMTAPGISHVGEIFKDRKESKNRQKDRRRAYIERNGTVKSNMRDRYIEHKARFPDGPATTSAV